METIIDEEGIPREVSNYDGVGSGKVIDIQGNTYKRVEDIWKRRTRKKDWFER